MAYLDNLKEFDYKRAEQAFDQIVEGITDLDLISTISEASDKMIEENFDVESATEEQLVEFLTPFKGGGIQIQSTIDKLVKRYPKSFGVLVNSLKPLTQKGGMAKDGRTISAIINSGMKQGMTAAAKLAKLEQQDGFANWLEAVRISTKKANVSEVRNLIISGLVSYYVGMGLLNGNGFSTTLLGRLTQAMKVGTAGARNTVNNAVQNGVNKAAGAVAGAAQGLANRAAGAASSALGFGR